MNLELAGVVWRSSWWLESRRSSIPSSSSSPVHLLRPAQTTFLKPIKGNSRTFVKELEVPSGAGLWRWRFGGSSCRGALAMEELSGSDLGGPGRGQEEQKRQGVLLGRTS
ncbi:hypothetical protein Taro_046013 [Colocasia esculenta]|uniref:Uncharacterized protein n=1 Tax=Colocasia esculenta TaxID=4460 RepID=A0A843X3K5_COLES|nr:hypothetical protein [Colocasia esculenta]